MIQQRSKKWLTKNYIVPSQICSVYLQGMQHSVPLGVLNTFSFILLIQRPGTILGSFWSISINISLLWVWRADVQPLIDLSRKLNKEISSFSQSSGEPWPSECALRSPLPQQVIKPTRPLRSILPINKCASTMFQTKTDKNEQEAFQRDTKEYSGTC